MDFSIASLWNGDKLSHEPIKLSVQSASNDDVVRINVEGLFFNDPPSPQSPPGPTDSLWDYEVVEAFFLNSTDGTYLEVEFCPHGHHIVLLLQGRRNIIDKLLPMKYSATIAADGKTWRGQAEVPIDYLPPQVDKFNAFAIHGSEPCRQYEQLYPQVHSITHPDFHRLDDFCSIDFDKILPNNTNRKYSAAWTSKMK